MTSETARRQALARLLRLLLYGEQSAALAFDILGHRRLRQGETPALLSALRHIGADERQHVALLSGLAQVLPAIELDSATTTAAERFFSGLASRDVGVHFTRIAALDSAVCLLLAALRKSQPALFHPVLHRIARDEARHVALATRFARRLCVQPTQWNAAADTRGGLADLLRHRADDMETLQMAPGRLLTRLREPPRFLRS